jgi:release factor glutamine methyltransferase
MTVAEALNVQNRSVSSRDAEVLLCAASGYTRSQLLANPEETLSARVSHLYQTYLDCRETNQPVAYIIGEKEFYSRRFLTDKRALVPRPETEGLVELAVSAAASYFWQHARATNHPCPVSMLEIGTGSGNIAISVALELSKQGIPTSLYAGDISSDALELAHENWQRLKEEDVGQRAKLHFFTCDLCEAPEIATASPFPFVLANLPYVPDYWATDPLAQPDVVFHEPNLALFGGNDGLDIYRRFFQQLSSVTKPGSRVFLEFGEVECGDMSALATDYHYLNHTVSKDYAGLNRILDITV